MFMLYIVPVLYCLCACLYQWSCASWQWFKVFSFWWEIS